MSHLDLKGESETNFMKVDEESCTKCGFCVYECPRGIITIEESTGFPITIRDLEADCIDCGHCVAVCSSSSLSHRSSELSKSLEIKKELIPSGDQIEHLLKSRRSIRVFSSKAVEKEKILKLIDIARYAPTGVNTQAVEWIVINDLEKVNKIRSLIVEWMEKMIEIEHDFAPMMESMVNAVKQGYDPIFRNAPVIVIATTGDKSMTGEQDVDIALSHFEIAALGHNLGTCWAGMLVLAANGYEPLRNELQLNNSYFYSMMLGYSKMSYKRIPERKSAKVSFR